MKIVFLKISSMRFYKGACPEDEPRNGGSFVLENGYGHEEFNFNPILLDGSDEPVCLGFFETKHSNGIPNAFHIEKIDGCGAYRNEPFVDDVLVVWCATKDGRLTVVGWYKHAQVYRHFQDWIMCYDDGYEEERCYNVKARAEDCVLLPFAERNRAVWSVPTKSYTRTFGFGQKPMVWYAAEPEAKGYLQKLLSSIEQYADENHLYTYPEQNP